MPNIKSAIKRVKIAEKKSLNNSIIRTKYKTEIKKYEQANADGKAEASELLSLAKKAIDHASSKGVISKNAASRKVSKLEKKLAVEPKKKTTAKKATKTAEKEPAVEEKAEKKPAKKTTTKKADTAKTTTKKASSKKSEE